MTAPPLPLMYSEIADWFHLVTAPEEYGAEWAIYRVPLLEVLGKRPRDLLELGAGGGNLASHYKKEIASCVLTDLSPGMQALSRTLNPDCEHILGDMRTLRLGRKFDAVLIHDAIMYMRSEADLARAVETAFVHCRPGGAAMVIPDFTRETFEPGTDCGGHDGKGRALRYLEWQSDPDPTGTTATVDYAYILQEDGKPPRALHDRHIVGCFPEKTWLDLMRGAGFAPRVWRGPTDGSAAETAFLGYVP